MNKALEFNVIVEKLKELAISEAAKSQIEALKLMTDPVLIQRHLNETSEANEVLKMNTSVPVNGLEGIQQALEKLKRQEILRPKALESVGYFLKDCQRMTRFMSDKALVAPQIVTYADDISKLESLSEAIAHAIVHGQVDDRATQNLYKIRKKITEIEDRIKQKLNQFLTSSGYQHMFADAIVSQRDGRYVVPIKSEHKKSFDGNVLDRSRSGGTVFIEPAAVQKLQAEITALRGDEEQEVYKILSTLSNQIASEMRAIEINYEVMTHYDFIFAKGKLSRRMNGISALITQDGTIQIINGRHPLLGENAVPLNLTISVPKRHLVITGPNTGGKTVTMKTVGLFVLMTQAGLQIPCDAGTVLPIYDQVLCDIGDGQSIAQNLSTFSAHITNIIKIIHQATRNSLVILDEIGAGTDPTEGMGIGIAVLEALSKKAATILASTHYNEIKDFANNHPLFLNGSMAFNLMSLKPEYKLIIGESGESNALLIALRLGMDDELIERAHEVAYKTQKTSVHSKPTSDFRDKLKEYKHRQTHEVSSTVKNEPEVDQHERAKPNTQMATKLVKRRTPKFKIGDSVYIHTMKRNGIVVATEDQRGDITVQVMGKKFKINHKRLSLHIKSDELYPEDYDMDIVTKTKAFRKTEKRVRKGKEDVLIIREE
ncbi:endonuclease MutS2 [Fusibacter ferrireducens]|uniref:Endonuclease MutS2 n=1 Tax=Fusibacter ferrireducens TaxID=2785058 RepID=A0ABR9ZWT6_9FIRM|nr:endonuclease MutS2 [Fusibacter ferrireducens]MBF4694335.1 endonuclease MutS2 [Fusibacter ferrireducens]